MLTIISKMFEKPTRVAPNPNPPVHAAQAAVLDKLERLEKRMARIESKLTQFMLDQGSDPFFTAGKEQR